MKIKMVYLIVSILLLTYTATLAQSTVKTIVYVDSKGHYISYDKGTTWQPKEPICKENTNTKYPTRIQTLVYNAYDGNTFISLDAGNTWKKTTQKNQTTNNISFIVQNPVNEMLVLNCENILSDFKLFVSDRMGNIIFKKAYSDNRNNQIEIPILSSQHNGVYIASILYQGNLYSSPFIICR